VLKHGVIEPLQVYFAGNMGPHRTSEQQDELAGVFTDGKQPIRAAAPNVQQQISSQRLFTTQIPVTSESALSAYDRILKEAGCSRVRDAIDERIVSDVIHRRFGQIVKSQGEVGGWPRLD